MRGVLVAALLGLVVATGLEDTDPTALASEQPATAPPSTARVEARSADLLAVGTVQGDRMTIHLSRTLDNAPVRNAMVAVVLRGTTHSTTADADGGYSFQSPDLRLTGTAQVLFQVTLGAVREDLDGRLEVAGGERPDEGKGGSRQLGWWLLNFAVCIGFLMLWSRRRKAQEPD